MSIVLLACFCYWRDEEAMVSSKNLRTVFIEYEKSTEELYTCLTAISKLQWSHRDDHVNTTVKILVVFAYIGWNHVTNCRVITKYKSRSSITLVESILRLLCKMQTRTVWAAKWRVEKTGRATHRHTPTPTKKCYSWTKGQVKERVHC